MDKLDDGEIGFVKEDRKRGTVRYGIRSKSKVYVPVGRRNTDHHVKGSLDTFSIRARHHQDRGTVEIGDEKFEVQHTFQHVSYSLNKKKRWEVVGNLESYVDEDPERQKERLKLDGAARRRGRRHVPAAHSDGDRHSSTSSDDSSGGEEEEPQASPFHVHTIVRDTDHRHASRADNRKVDRAHYQAYHSEEESTIDYEYKMTRRGRVAVPTHESRRSKPKPVQPLTEEEEALAQSFFTVTISSKRAKDQRTNLKYRTRRYNPWDAVSKAHKYRYTEKGEN
jgi:hypothetical protein